jgi:hypothetical protein
MAEPNNIMEESDNDISVPEYNIMDMSMHDLAAAYMTLNEKILALLKETVKSHLKTIFIEVMKDKEFCDNMRDLFKDISQ